MRTTAAAEGPRNALADDLSEQEEIVKKIEKTLDIFDGQRWQRDTERWNQAGRVLLKVRYLVALSDLERECLMRLVTMDKMGLARTGRCTSYIYPFLS